MNKIAGRAGTSTLRRIGLLAGMATVLTCSHVHAQTTGPTIYQGRALVTEASSGCQASVGDSFGATLRIPGAMPHHFRLALLNDHEALHLERNTSTSVALFEIDDDASLTTETIVLASGSSITTLANGAAEASAS
ncbi:MAG TPA: hypothetical protein VKS60_16175, partial [Stellaceae bacterium]|nr:hypothetical protein [Stellaceae bacterium]